MKRTLLGLDSLRFFCALWVVFFHNAIPPLFLGNTSPSPVVAWLKAAYEMGGFFNGQAAVILFFIISGFCIHYPQAGRRPLHVPSFYARRLLRIGIPWLVLEILVRLFMPGHPLQSWMDPVQGKTMLLRIGAVTWTLRCEIAYYALYPLLLVTGNRAGWLRIVAVSFVIALVVVAFKNGGNQFSGFLKVQWNVLVGLPAWLMGCLLAEDFAARKEMPEPGATIWLWRVAIWAGSTLTWVLMAAWHIGMPWTLNFFAILGYFYIRAELLHYQKAKPVRAFELLGMASYSMYLTHLVVIAYMGVFGRLEISWGEWAKLMLAVFAVTGFYYLLVELPSHQLARRIRPPRRDSTKSGPREPNPVSA